MTEISQSQSGQEALAIALWQTPFPEPDTGTISELSQSDAPSQEQVVGNIAVGDGSVLPDLGADLSKFGSWESVGSTIVHRAETLSGFNPKGGKFDPVAWEKFLNKFTTIPFFLAYTLDYRDAAISKTSLKKAVDAVADLLENITTKENFEDILKTIKKVVAVAVKNNGQKEKNANLQVGILSRNKGKLYLGAARTTVQMVYKKGKGCEQLQQTLKIYRGYGVLDFDMCKRNADTLKKWDFKNVDDWVRDTNSYGVPPNDSPAWNN
ncbi:hypothetical protein N8J89_18445 [Crossiella sp. CA-258035]|uniref:hypothetical protein n=1 Tax=Crossiella sp. CA-258035 TaxID=2981138 RepID=UPI0024BBF878|nr:hypothetical protein [Crossiella sp. CA-258035]WHT22972.1 hypothetical protein N8J89_18445 [Crossiella sp. CA-258035]